MRGRDHSGTPMVAVPNAVGLTQAAATTAITDAGLVVGTVSQASSATVASGNVISQSPAAGTSVASGSVVALTVSTGPVMVVVPDVVGQTQAAATTAITGANLTLGNVTQASSATVASGSVISESPAAGTSVASGSAVALTVSTGPAMVAVPNVVGQAQAAATTAITGAGLTLGTVTQASSATVASGNVISESPAAGTSVAPAAAVNLTVSTGAAAAGASGKAFDGPVVGATINAYPIQAGSVVATTPIASAVTDSNGSYSLTLPAGYSGTVVLQSIGGTFVDDTTGKTVPALPLSALVPNAAGTFSAQLTPLSTIVEQAAIQIAQASATDPAQIAITLYGAIGSFFGGQTDVLGTPLVDVSTAGCNTAASQASVDASLLVTALSTVANNNHVATTALVDALVWDYVSDFVFDGQNNGGPISVQLASGSGSVLLCTIESNCAGGSGSGFQAVLAAAIAQFTASGANLCGAQLSAATVSNLTTVAAVKASPPAPGALPVSVAGTVNGLPPSSWVVLQLGGGGVGRCTTSNPCILATYQLNQGTGNGTLTFSATAGSAVSGLTDWTLQLANHGLAAGSDSQCSLGSPTSGSVAPNATSVSVTGIVVNCAPRVYPIGGQICCLLAGQTVVLQDESTDNLSITGANGFFSFPTALTLNSAYSATVLTQPSSGGPCVVSGGANGTGGGTVTGAGTNIIVNCGNPPAPTLNNPNGLAFGNNLLYLANAGANQVLVFSETLDSSHIVTGLTVQGAITQDISNPTRLAFDPSGRYLFVTNLGSNSVTVYDTANGNQEVAASKITGSSINRPLGIAVDRSGNVYVAENSGNSISVFQPKAGGGYAEASFSPISTDGAGTAFVAPGAMAFYSVGYGDLLVVGTGAGKVLLYQAPFTRSSTPVFTLSASACASAPTGPTGFAMQVGGISGGPLSDSSLWVSNFYAGDVLGYGFGSLFSSSCPTPSNSMSTAPGSNANPEGIVIDPYGNVFVSDSSSNHLSVYAPGPLSVGPALTY